MRTWQNKVIEIECGAETLRLETIADRDVIKLFIAVREEDYCFFLPVPHLDKITDAIQQLQKFLSFPDG